MDAYKNCWTQAKWIWISWRVCSHIKGNCSADWAKFEFSLLASANSCIHSVILLAQQDRRIGESGSQPLIWTLVNSDQLPLQYCLCQQYCSSAVQILQSLLFLFFLCFQQTTKEMIARSCATIVTHPFHGTSWFCSHLSHSFTDSLQYNACDTF